MIIMIYYYDRIMKMDYEKVFEYFSFEGRRLELN